MVDLYGHNQSAGAFPSAQPTMNLRQCDPGTVVLALRGRAFPSVSSVFVFPKTS